MDPITFPWQRSCVDMTLNDQTITSPGDYAAPSEQVAPTTTASLRMALTSPEARQTSPARSGLSMDLSWRPPPLWSFLDDPTSEACHLIIFKEFAQLVKECAPDAIVRNSCEILRTVVTARYLQYKIEGFQPADDDESCCFWSPLHPVGDELSRFNVHYCSLRSIWRRCYHDRLHLAITTCFRQHRVLINKHMYAMLATSC